MLATERCLIFFRDAAFDLNAAQRVLVERGLVVTRQGERLDVCWEDDLSGEDPSLYITFAEGENVAKEAEELGAETEYAAALRDCKARFEIQFDDLDEILDEINLLIHVQLTLKDSTCYPSGVCVFR